MSIVVYTHGWQENLWLEEMVRHFPDREIYAWADPARADNADYVLVWQPPAQLFSSLGGLKAIFSLGAGVDHILGLKTLPDDIPLVRVVDPDLTGRMTQYIAFHCLRYLRRFKKFEAQQRQHLWQSDYQPHARELNVGILGLGELGMDAGRALSLLGFQVAGWSRSRKTDDVINCFHGEDGLNEMLAMTDILVCLLPLTSETRGILNLKLFGKLGRKSLLGGPILINAGRGGLQVETDILTALDEGVLYAATLDVFEKEPLAGDSALWDHPGITITPHNAADSSPEAICRYVSQQIRAFEAGKPFENLVDRARGY